MTNYREILRMNSLGFNKTEIAQSLQCSRTTVRTVIRLAEEHNLQYPGSSALMVGSLMHLTRQMS